MSLNESELLKIDDIQYQFEWNAKVVSSEKDKRIQTDSFFVKALPMLDDAFAAQRLGWLGGDIATSIPLPNSIRSSSPERIIWLFGDTIVGVSDDSRFIII